MHHFPRHMKKTKQKSNAISFNWKAFASFFTAGVGISAEKHFASARALSDTGRSHFVFILTFIRPWNFSSESDRRYSGSLKVGVKSIKFVQESNCTCIYSAFVLTHAKIIFGPGLRKRNLRTYANSEYTDQPAHPRSPIRIFAVHLHNIGTLSKMKD